MTINSNRWINALPNAKSKLIEENHNLNSDIWIKTLSGPKQKNNNTIKKYSAVSVFFIIGLILVSVIKNEARNLQKEINNLRTSISEIKLNLHQAVLDHQVITSPQNISNLANDHLGDNFTFYKKSQIRMLGDEDKEIISKLEKNKKISSKAKLRVAKKIKEKKIELKKLQEIYLRPDKLPKKVKFEVVKKIEKTKTQLKHLYSSPEEIVKPERVRKWAGIQIVKAFLGIPVVPGR